MYIYRLSNALAEAGHQVDVIHCIDAYHLQHPKEPEVAYKEHKNVRRHGLQSKYGWLSPLLTHQTGHPLLKMGQIRRVLESKPYDVIHFHNISLLGPYILELRPEQGLPIKMYTTHEHWLICPTHVLWKFNRRACEKPECLRCVLMNKRPPQIWRYTHLLEKTSREVDLFVSPSRFTSKMHAQRGFSQPVAHLPYFLDRADRDWQNPGTRPQERPYFLFVGRLEVIKGLHTLIPLWKQVQGYDLLVAGTGTYETELRSLAEGNPHIRFLGVLPQRELGNLYYHATATIVPSITYETFGIIIIESFARKTPVIVRDLGALPEVVHDSQGGYVYKNDQEILDAINTLATMPELRRQLGENGYNAFLQNWCKEAHMEKYFGFLNQTAIKKYGSIPWESG